VHEEAFAGQKLRRLGVDVNRETKEDLGLRALFEETEGKERACEWKQEWVITRNLNMCMCLPLKKNTSRNLFVVLDPPKLLPAFDDVTDSVVREFLDHG
jgi:hypothetical protein